MKNKNTIGIISLIIVIAEFIGFLILGFNMQPGDEMAYGMIVFYIAFPLTALILSILFAAKKSAFFFPVAILASLSPVILSGIFFGWSGIEMQDLVMGIFTLIPCAVGGIIGFAINRIRKK